jgi:hypothetical protein
MKLLDWYRRWRERRRPGIWARHTLRHPDDASELALAKAQAIRAALKAGQPICRHCFNPYTVKHREFGEQFRVRAILMVPDYEPELRLCDFCFDAVSSSYNPRATMPGTSNCGPRNFLIQ